MTEWEGSRLRKSVVNCRLALRSTSSHRHHFPSSLSLRHHHRPTRHRPRCRRQRQRTALIPPAQSAPFAWTAAAISTDIEPFLGSFVLSALRLAHAPSSRSHSVLLGHPRSSSLPAACNCLHNSILSAIQLPWTITVNVHHGSPALAPRPATRIPNHPLRLPTPSSLRFPTMVSLGHLYNLTPELFPTSPFKTANEASALTLLNTQAASVPPHQHTPTSPAPIQRTAFSLEIQLW